MRGILGGVARVVPIDPREPVPPRRSAPAALHLPRPWPYIWPLRDQGFAHAAEPARSALSRPFRLRLVCSRRLRPGAPGPDLAGRGSAVLCAGGAAGGAGGGQRLRRQDRRDPQPDVRRSDLPALLRHAGHARQPGRAAAALARLRRHRRCGRARGHQQPRHRRRRSGQGLARRQARVRGRDRAEGFALRSRGAAHQGAERALPGARIRRFRRAAGRRPGARHRQPVRGRPDRDPRHRLGGGAHPDRHHRLPVLHPDRRRHQSGQFRRRAGRSRRQAGRHQHRDLLALGRLAGHRLRHPGQHGARWWSPRPRAAAAR